jgi:hypothetical protein
MWLLSARRSPRNERLFRLYVLAALCLFLLAGLAFFQSLRFEHYPLEHPLWKVAREYAGPVAGAISVAPERTRAALVAFAPLIALLLSFVLFEDLNDALNALKRLSYFSAALAFYGIIQHVFLPLQLGFGPKIFDLDSLTAFFVNRNSAGTFFGAGTLLSLSLAFYYLRSMDPAKLGEKLLRYPASDDAHTYCRFALFALLALLQAIALFLTKSRGATGASFVGIVVFIILMAKHKLSRGNALAVPDDVAQIVRAGVLAILVICVFWLFAGQASYRQDAQGVDYTRLCVFRSVIAAIQDNWKFGAGFGAFSDVFPAYRDGACAGVASVLEAAHNSYLEGTLGLGVAFPLIVAAGLIVLIRAFRFGMRTRHQYRFAPAMGLAMLALICLHSAVDFSMQIPGVSLFIASILGCCCTIALERDETVARNPWTSTFWRGNRSLSL